MTSLDALLRQAAAIRAKAGPQQTNFVQSDEWLAIRALLIQQTVDAFPDVYTALCAMFTQLERDSVTDYEQVQSAVVQTLYPYADARLAISESLMQLYKNTSKS